MIMWIPEFCDSQKLRSACNYSGSSKKVSWLSILDKYTILMKESEKIHSVDSIHCLFVAVKSVKTFEVAIVFIEKPCNMVCC